LKIILHFNRAARYGLLACLVGAALGLSVVRFWLAPQANRFRGELQERVGAMLGETAQIARLSARMRGFNPVLVLKDVRIGDEAGSPLAFEQVRVGLSLWRSLWAGAPALERVELTGARLTLLRRADGSFALAGLKAKGGAPAWLLAEGIVKLKDIELVWRGDAGAERSLGKARLTLSNEGARHRLDAALELPDALGQSLRAIAEFEGDAQRPKAWRGRIYLAGAGLRATDLDGLAAFPLAMRSGQADFKLWLDWNEGALRRARGRVDLERPALVRRGEGGGESRLSLDKLGGWLDWRLEDAGWRLDLRRFSLSLFGQPWPESDIALALARDADGGARSLSAAASYLRFEDIRLLLESVFPLAAVSGESLRGFAPRGELRAARLFYQADGGIGFCGDFAGLGFAAWKQAPGLKGFGGRVCGSDRQGRIDLNVEAGGLSAPALFRRDIQLDALRGVLRWRRTEEEGWLLSGEGLELAAPGLAASARFRYVAAGGREDPRPLPDGEGDVPRPGSEARTPANSPFLDLRASLRDADAARLRDYMPLAAMPKASATWLGEAFDGGIVKRAEILFHGPLDAFPFADQEGAFQAQADAENVELDFDPDWPHLYGVKAKLGFNGANIAIDADSGRIGDIPFKTVRAEILDFIGDGRLHLHGEVETSLPAAMRFLQATPVRRIPERLLKAADPQGAAGLSLRLKIPLDAEKGEVEVDGDVRFENSELHLKTSGLAVRRMNGVLHFTASDLKARGVKGEILGSPASLDVSGEGEDILLGVEGEAGTEALASAFPATFWQSAAGKFGYRLDLRIPESLDAASGPLRARLRADLAGLALRLPPPLGKSAGMPKKLQADWETRGDKSRLDLDYGREAEARLAFGEESGRLRLEGGNVAVGRPSSEAGEAGLGIFAKLDELDADAWRDWLAANLGEASGGTGMREFEIDAARVLRDGEDLGAVSLHGRRGIGDAWTGSVASRYGKGRFQADWPPLGKPALSLDMDALKLPKLSGDDQAAPRGTFDPARLPNLRVRAERLLWREVELGALELETERRAQGLAVKKLAVRKADRSLSLTGGWTRADGKDETRLEGRLSLKSLDRLLTDFGHGGEIRATPLEAGIDLAWSGAPQDFSARRVGGEIKLKLGRGAILKYDPGLSRALGVLNLTTLRRLLLLDFSDLFGKGMAYDGMEGRFHLGAGQATTEGFLIDAVAARIFIAGRVGLIDRDFDQKVAVAPHTLASLPIAGAMVGGAAVGAAIDMAQQLAGRESINIASNHYAITGSWDHPKIARIEGNMTLDMLDRAWTDFKDFSGFGDAGEKP
jgi:uncharacterized protein (TIGR02099 family)